MPIDPQDGGPDDWFVPASDGYPNDWFVPESDGYPDDWFVPASAAPGTTQPAPDPQVDTANPAPTPQPAPRPDPLADYWSRVPASRVGAMAWHPPIFLNSQGQSPLPAPAPLNAPWLGPTRGGSLGPLANLLGPGALGYGLLGGVANLPSANPAGLSSLQQAGLASGNNFAPPPILSSFASLAGASPEALLDATGNTVRQFPFMDGTALDARSPYAQSGPAAPLLNSQPADPSAIPPLQTAGSISDNSKRSAQLSRPDMPGPNQPAPPTQSADEDSPGSNSPAGSQSAPDDSGSIVRVVRDPTGRALAIIHAQPVASAPQTESDATSDALRPGAKYAQINNAKTGNPLIDRTTDMLLAVLQQSIQAIGPGWGRFFGTRVHTDFANRVRQLDLPGIGQDGVEQSYHFDLEDLATYGMDGSIRTDITLRNSRDPRQDAIAVYDLKTGDAVLRPRRVDEILRALKRQVPVITLYYRTGDAGFPTGRAPPQ
jgi:hypothetical protein